MTAPDPASRRSIVQQTYAHAATLRQRESAVADCGESMGFVSCRQSGLGCGDPTTLAALRAGETVLDLGSGLGFDCLVAAHSVGLGGQVIGIDLTREMVRLARNNAIEADVFTVSFLLGEIERLPLRDALFDVVISNCVINLCPDKTSVLSEAYRVLKSGGRLAVSDIVALQPLPDEIADDLALYVGCVAGAAPIEALLTALDAAGFRSVRVGLREESPRLIEGWAPGRGLERFVAAAEITATKP